jgi:hypothetical protein
VRAHNGSNPTDTGNAECSVSGIDVVCGTCGPSVKHPGLPVYGRTTGPNRSAASSAPGFRPIQRQATWSPGRAVCGTVRWSRAGRGKRGGVRVVFHNQPAEGRVWLLLIHVAGTGSSGRDGASACVSRRLRDTRPYPSVFSGNAATFQSRAKRILGVRRAVRPAGPPIDQVSLQNPRSGLSPTIGQGGNA